ncbi:hypothetical protein [Roseomonas sp. 18066]|uniref:hypothetical protein n=1 Tax=Roseomonas sp. 18066 TaxID=2681412 RepID=UPI0013578D5D|nr:hypothetical protein [Roseomonas sp. 18066]
MPQLIIRSDHSIRVSAPSEAGSDLWIRTAVLTIAATGKTVEATSRPCPSPDVALAEVVAIVRRQAGFSPD